MGLLTILSATLGATASGADINYLIDADGQEVIDADGQQIIFV
jgi:hypothetical protein